MNERIKELAEQCVTRKFYVDHSSEEFDYEKFAVLVIQDCANFVRETYDDKASESIAFYLEMHYGLHGDYT